MSEPPIALIAGGEQPAERISQGKGYALALPVIELAAVGVSGSLQVVQRPEPEVHCRGKSAGAGSGVIGSYAAHLGGPGAELGEKDIAGHGDGQLTALHSFGPLVGGFQLCVHPLVGQEAGAVFRDAVAAHEAYCFTKHVSAVAGVPKLGCGTDHVGLGVEQDILDERVGFKFGTAWAVRIVDPEREQLDGSLLGFFESFHLRPAALNAARLQECGLLLLQWIEGVEETCGGEAKGGGGFAGGPHIHQAVERIFALLNALFVTKRAGPGALCAAESLTLVADDRLNRREQLGGGHEADRHAGAAKDRFDDFAVVVVGNDDVVLHGVSADDAAGGNFEAEDGVARGGKLVDQLFGRRTAVECAFVGVLENDDATAFDARVVGVDRCGDEVGEDDVGDEAAALFYLQPGLFAVFPLRHGDSSTQHAGVDADIGDWLSEGEGSAPGLAIFTGLRRSGQGLVAGYLVGGAALVDGRQSQKAGEAGSGSAAVDPG